MNGSEGKGRQKRRPITPEIFDFGASLVAIMVTMS